MESKKMQSFNERAPVKKRRWVALVLAVLLALAALLGYIYIGSVVRQDEIHWLPTYEQEDISALLYKSERTEEDYAKIYAQTGLTKLGVEGLIEQNLYAKIFSIQKSYFATYEKRCKRFAPLTYAEYIDGNIEFAILQDGDILVTDSIFCSWFRCGHAALVVDAAQGQVLSAVEIGKKSALSRASQFDHFASFMIIRPKVSKETKAQVVEYAKENLIGLSYRLTIGIFTSKDAEDLVGTQCGHLAWYAYQKFGVDLDSNGGMLVLPQDLANSNDVELVQTFGFDPQTLWR